MTNPQSHSLALPQSQRTVPQILRDYAEHDSKKFSIFFRRMRGNYAADCLSVCIRHLARHSPSSDVSRQMFLWLSSTVDYMPVLLNPQMLPCSGTAKAALALRDADTQFFTKLARFLQDPKTPKPVSVIVRALEIIPALGECGILISWLRMLASHSDEQVRLQSAKTLCELRPTRAMVERQLQSAEPQTRADALEALWRVPSAEAKAIFSYAAADSDYRVVTNALVGLHLNDDTNAVERIILLATHRSAMARVAAIAAMAKTMDRRCIPALQALAGDLSQAVRDAAKIALLAFPVEAPEPDVKVENVSLSEPAEVAPVAVTTQTPQKASLTFDTPAFRLL